ncbi:MAG: hypothetical protein ACHP83_21610 [Burkholderiales bacterium]
MNAAQRAQRRHDLLLAADVLRQQIDASLTNLEPAAQPLLHGLTIGLWWRRHHATSGTWAAVALLAAAGGAIGRSGIGRFALRHRRWLRRASLVWLVVKFLRR